MCVHADRYPPRPCYNMPTIKDFVILHCIGGCLVAQNSVAEIWYNAW